MRSRGSILEFESEYLQKEHRHTVRPAIWGFLERIEKTDVCWIWRGSLDSYGYGTFCYGAVVWKAHRVAYELLVGWLDPELTIDHLCRNPWCVRPDHLEPVTSGENSRRRSATKTHCRHGHEFTQENTHMYRGGRICRTCKRLGMRALRASAKGRKSYV